MNRRIIFFLCILTVHIFKAQEDLKPYTFNALANLKAPQTADFVRYGNIPINKFVGEPNLTIPLFNLKSSQAGDEISISLGYNFSGFIPNKRPDIVGLNWFLNAGGVIARQVNSIPDDQIGDSSTGSANGMPVGLNKHGLIVGLRSKSNCLPYHSNVGIFNLSNPNIGYFSYDLDYKLKGCDPNNDAYDGDADIFSFNFGGYSGKFFLGTDNQVKIIGDDVKGFKIDISGMASQPFITTCKPLSSSIKITDTRGNEYYFGGESRNLEYNIAIKHNPNPNLTGNQNETKGGAPIINSWFLRQIVYVNGEVVNFNYKDDSSLTDNFCNGTPGSTLDWHGANATERKKFIIYNKSYNQDVACVSNTGVGWDPNNGNNCGGSDYSYMITKKAILEQVATTNYKLKLNYSLQPYIFNYEPTSQLTYFQQIKNLKIDSLGLYTSDDRFIKSFQMDYQLKGGTTAQNSYPRLFLTSVMETGKTPYTFSYNIGSETLPKATTKQIDHWGYYNGKTSNENLTYPIPTYATDANGDYYFTNSVRDANFTYSSKGILNKVTYPTKGYTEFEFESPTYDYRMERKKINEYFPSLQTVYGIAGGTRVKKVKHYSDAGELAQEKQYSYGNGILFSWPRYIAVNSYGNPTFQSNTWLRSSAMNMNVLESSVINYGTVTESETGNGNIISTFSNYLTHPDINDTNSVDNPNHPYVNSPADLALIRNYIGLFYNDVSLERGKLLQELINNNNGQIVKKTVNTYNTDPNRFGEYSTVLHLSGPAVQANKRYYYNTNLTKNETWDYFYEGSQQKVLLTTQNFIYNTTVDNLLTQKQTIFPNSTVSENQIKYAYQDNNTLLIAKNMTGIPLEYISKTKQNLNDIGKVVSHSKNIYPATLPTAQTGTLMLPISTQSYDLQNGTASTDITYDKYDDKGNVVQYTSKDGIPTTIIWGYNKTQPIAKIVGIDSDAVSGSLISSIVNASNTDASDPSTEPALITALDSFRKNSSLAGYQITTYTYDPLIGVRSITPPSGIREVYLYDSANRLKEIRENNAAGKLIKEFKYNYKH